MSAINDWDNKILRLLIDREVGSVGKLEEWFCPKADILRSEREYWVFPKNICIQRFVHGVSKLDKKNILLNSVLQNIDPVEKMYFIPFKRNFMIVAGFKKIYIYI
jgi:hypothetical protein